MALAQALMLVNVGWPCLQAALLALLEKEGKETREEMSRAGVEAAES